MIGQLVSNNQGGRKYGLKLYNSWLKLATILLQSFKPLKYYNLAVLRTQTELQLLKFCDLKFQHPKKTRPLTKRTQVKQQETAFTMSTQPNSSTEKTVASDQQTMPQKPQNNHYLKANGEQNTKYQNENGNSSPSKIDQTSAKPNQELLTKERGSFSENLKSVRMASRSPTLHAKQRNLIDSSYDFSSRNDEESIMESKSFDFKKRSSEASNSKKTSSKHAKLSESHHDIKIELEAHSQSSQDAADTEIKEESTSGHKEATQEFLKSSQSPGKTSQGNSEMEGIKQFKEDSDQADTPSSENVISQSPLKGILHISEKQQHSLSSESNLSTPESKTGTRIIVEDQVMSDEKAESSTQNPTKGIPEPEDEEQPLAQEQEAKKEDDLEQEDNISNSATENDHRPQQEFFYENFQQNNIRFEDVEINDVDEGQQQWSADQNYSNEFSKQGTEKFRAKLYQLDGDGRWNDLGTGYFSIDPIPDQNLYKMTLQQEHDSTVDLLENEIIQPHIQFHRQRETIITWTDKQRDQDLAVSFQNNSGAWQTWQRICQILGTDPDHHSDGTIQHEEFDNFTVIARETIQNMAEELKSVNMMEPQAKFDIADKFLENDQHNLIKLGELFEEIENESIRANKDIVDEHLLWFFCIYKGLISLNDNRLLETLMSNKFYLQTFGALEWDPDALQPSVIDPLYTGQQDVMDENDEGEMYMGQDVQENLNEEMQAQDLALAEQNSFDMEEDKVAQVESNSSESPEKQDQELPAQAYIEQRINLESQNHCKMVYGQYGIGRTGFLSQSRIQGGRNDRAGKLWKDQIVSTKQNSQDDNQNVEVSPEAVEVEQREESSNLFKQAFEGLNKVSNSHIHQALEGVREELVEETQIQKDEIIQEQQESAIVQTRVSEGSQPQYTHEQVSEQMIIEQKSCLNYREFLQNIVKFKKIIDFNQEPLRQSQLENTQGQGQENGMELQGSDKFDFEKENQPTDEPDNGGYAGAKPSIEERIHINYRLQYLKDTVMARYIDEQASNIINQLIMANNKEIVGYIFAQPKSIYSSEKSLKDQIIDKIRDKSDLNTRQQAIEFMIELCQILKNLQVSPGGLGGGGASSFIYGSGCNNSSNINSRQIYEQLNSANFIGLLAETFSIFTPNSESFEILHSFNGNDSQMKQTLYELFKRQSQPGPENGEDTQEIEQEDPLPLEEQIEQNYQQMLRLDQMKINSMEIIISFQQSIHVPNSSINKYITGSDQSSSQYPFLKQLVSHLIYSPDQGIKVQICDFFKGIFDLDQNQYNSSKDTLYNHVLLGFLTFIQKVNKDESIRNLSDNDHPKLKSHEYTLYLILQIINKVVAEHRYTLRQWICSNCAIPKIAKLCKLKSKLVNIEIVKFYKSIMRIKDPCFISEITKKNLFYPINEIFVATYDARNPPMIQSCIRELFEMILGKNTDKGENEFPIPKLAFYLIKDDEQSKQIIYNPEYREVFPKFHQNDGVSMDFVIESKPRQSLDMPEISSRGSQEGMEDSGPFRPSDGSFYQNQSYYKNKRKYRGTKINFQQNLDDEDVFIDYNNSNEILECEENGFDNILPQQKQQPHKKQMNINTFEDQEEKVEDSSLSPLASKSKNWNNNFQENLFEDLDVEKDSQPNNKTSEYLFNYDHQEEEEENNNLQLDKQSDEAASNQNSQREVEYDTVFKTKKLSGSKWDDSKSQEHEHNSKAFDKIKNDKKSQSLVEEQQIFKESLLKRRQNSGENQSFLSKFSMKKDNSLKLEIFESLENLSKDAKYSSPKMSPRATLTDNHGAKPSKFSNKALEQKIAKQFTSKSMDKVSNNSSDYHLGDDDLAKDMGIFGASQGTDLKKKISNPSQGSHGSLKHKVHVHAASVQPRRFSPSSKSSSQSAVNQSSGHMMKDKVVTLRRKSFDDQENIGIKQTPKLNSADKSDNILLRRDAKVSSNLDIKKLGGRQSADKSMYLSQPTKNIECAEFPYKSGSQSPIPEKSPELDISRPVLGLKRRMDPDSGIIVGEKQEDEVKEESPIPDLTEEGMDNLSKATKKQKVES